MKYEFPIYTNCAATYVVDDEIVTSIPSDIISLDLSRRGPVSAHDFFFARDISRVFPSKITLHGVRQGNESFAESFRFFYGGVEQEKIFPILCAINPILTNPLHNLEKALTTLTRPASELAISNHVANQISHILGVPQMVPRIIENSDWNSYTRMLSENVCNYLLRENDISVQVNITRQPLNYTEPSPDTFYSSGTVIQKATNQVNLGQGKIAEKIAPLLRKRSSFFGTMDQKRLFISEVGDYIASNRFVEHTRFLTKPKLEHLFDSYREKGNATHSSAVELIRVVCYNDTRPISRIVRNGIYRAVSTDGDIPFTTSSCCSVEEGTIRPERYENYIKILTKQDLYD